MNMNVTFYCLGSWPKKRDGYEGKANGYNVFFRPSEDTAEV